MSRVADPNTKSTLLRAAEEIFAERGLAGAKIEEIARRAGVSKGSFYLHFDSKEGALKHLVESFLARCQSYFAPPSAYPSLPEGPEELFDFSVERDVRIYEFLWENRAFLRILTACQGEYDYLVQAFRDEMDRRTREWADYCRREGLYRKEVDVDLAASLMSGAYHQLSVRMMASASRPPLETWLEFALETFFRAFGTTEMIEMLNHRNAAGGADIHDPSRRTAASVRPRRLQAAEHGEET